MDFRIFPAIAMAEIHRILHHSEAIFLEPFSEILIGPLVFLGFGRKVKIYDYPHDSVLIESVKVHHNSG
jgi:hypothetical protein